MSANLPLVLAVCVQHVLRHLQVLQRMHVSHVQKGTGSLVLSRARQLLACTRTVTYVSEFIAHVLHLGI